MASKTQKAQEAMTFALEDFYTHSKECATCRSGRDCGEIDGLRQSVLNADRAYDNALEDEALRRPA